MEFGPRALGNRSILTDPRRDDMKDILNARIKHREPFRPFAPSILAERTGEWYEQDYPSPFMILVYKTKADKRDKVPAVNHVDDTGRLQTVERHVNPRYYRLIEEFERQTGVPILLNTSFNENEPIVMTPGAGGRHLPEDAHGRARARQPRGAPHVNRRPRLLVLNQYYEPGVEATGRLLAQLCSDLARDFDVTVVTATLPNASAGREIRDGVEVIRVHSTAFARSAALAARAELRHVSRPVAAGWAERRERPDVVLSMTDPPVIANVALVVARSFRAPLVVVSQDVFPETAVRLGRLDNRAVVFALQALIRRYLRRADRVVAIGETMRARLVAKGARAERSWSSRTGSTRARSRRPPRDNPWAREHGLRPRVRRHALRQRRTRAGARRAHPRGDAPARRSKMSWWRSSAAAHATTSSSRSRARSRPETSAFSRTSPARCSRSRCPRQTFTSSGWRAGSRATSSRAGSTESSRWLGR